MRNALVQNSYFMVPSSSYSRILPCMTTRSEGTMRTPGRKPVCEFAIVEVQVPSNPQDHFPPGSPACLGYRHASANLQGVNLHHETAPESHRPNRGHLLGACTPLMRNASPHAHHGLPALEQQ